MNDHNSSDDNNQNESSAEDQVIEGEISYLTAGDTPEPVAEPAANESNSVTERSFWGRIGHFFFGADTPVGKFLRNLFKWTVVILISLVIGVTFSYFYFYRPAAAEVEQTKASLESTKQKVTDTEDALSITEQNLTSLESQYEQTLEELDMEKAHTLYFEALNGITTVQLELQRNDELAAEVAFKLTRDKLEELLPFVEGKNSDLADKLVKRIDVVFEDIDPVNTNADMEQLRNNTLKELEELLFPTAEISTGE